MYAMLLLLTTIVSCILLAPGLHDKLESVPFCKDNGKTDDSGGSFSLDSITNPIGSSLEDFTVDCSQAVGYLAVYR